MIDNDVEFKVFSFVTKYKALPRNLITMSSLKVHPKRASQLQFELFKIDAMCFCFSKIANSSFISAYIVKEISLRMHLICKPLCEKNGLWGF